MSEKLGIKETKEIITASMELGKFIRERAKDGLGWKDAGALIGKLFDDKEFRALILEAAKDADKSLAEIKDLDFDEGIELLLEVRKGL